MRLKSKKINKRKVGFFRFKKLGSKYLLTNDIGRYSFLTPQQFDLFLSGKIEQIFPDIYKELQNNGFIYDEPNWDELSQRYLSRNVFLNQGTSLHIIVVTLRCDHKCIYCQSSAKNIKAAGLDMDIYTAQKAVDRIFESPSKCIIIEFQGGEPLVNFDAIKFIVKYALRKNKKARKKLMFTIVTNFTFMNKEILNFIIDNNIQVGSSLDGPEDLHNKQRISIGKKNSYQNTVRWLRILRREYKKTNLSFRPSALVTVTRFSLHYSNRIIDEYVNLGLDTIHLRPVSPFGISLQIWNRINYRPEDFLDFYTKSLDYIINLNIKGKILFERFAKIFLTKILTDTDINYLDIRSPCGAGIGQLAYNFNGDVYTCDEGRMLSAIGDESFRIGNVKKNNYREIMKNPIVRTMCVASCLDSLPECYQCVYKPYCGVCPVYNHKINGNIFKKSKFLCKIYGSILDYIFIKLQDDKIKNMFYKKWLINK